MSQNKDNILLSICIPTYNRSAILDQTLKTYVDDPAFGEQIEIVISDNCSTDNTQQVAEKFVKRFDNIHYYRNEKNIIDLNFIKVLSLGKGLYLKLMNDTVTLKPGALKSILETLQIEKVEMNPTLFFQNIPYLNSNNTVVCKNLNELVSNVSFWITWIANFGIWKKDFELLENKDRCAHLHFLQTDWTIRLINKNKNSTIYFNDYFNVEKESNKRGYNLFQVFGVNYLSLYNEYLDSKILSIKTFNTEKYRLFRYFFVGWYRILVVAKSDFFEKDDAIKILMKIYWTKPYFYLGIMFTYVKNILVKLKK